MTEKEESSLPLDGEESPSLDEDFLRTAACLQTLNEKVLTCAHPSQSVSDLIFKACSQHILVYKDNSYAFSCDEIRQQIYESMPKGAREKLHFRIAKRLWKGGCDEEEVLYQFLQGEAVCQQNIANRSFISSLRSLCLTVGCRSVKASNSDFASGAKFLNFGVRLLRPDSWEDEYDLALAIHCAAAEANYCDSNFDLVEKSVAAVLENARTFDDKLGIYTTQVHLFAAKCQRAEAINVGLEVLKKLGETFPSRPNRVNVKLAFMRLQYRLRGKTNESILRLPPMENKRKLAAVQMMNLLFTHTVMSRPILLPLLVFRLVTLTLDYGLSVMSSLAFSGYGMMLCRLKCYDMGYRYGTLGLTLYDRFPVQEWLPRVYLTAYGAVNGCVKPLESTIEPLEKAYHTGLETGDIEVEMMWHIVFTERLVA